MRLIASVLGLSLLLSGCSLFQTTDQVEITTKPVNKPVLVVASPDELNLRNVEWIIITKDNYEEVFAEVTSSGRPLALFALTDKGYENLGLNISDIRAYIEQQQAMINAYKLYYDQSEKVLDKAVVIE